MPTPSIACAAASTANDGAAALSTDAEREQRGAADQQLAQPGAPGGERQQQRGHAPGGAEDRRSCPAVAVETPNSRAMSGSMGDSTSSAGLRREQAREQDRAGARGEGSEHGLSERGRS